jgi:hypothetical protein
LYSIVRWENRWVEVSLPLPVLPHSTESWLQPFFFQICLILKTASDIFISIKKTINSDIFMLIKLQSSEDAQQIRKRD